MTRFAPTPGTSSDFDEDAEKTREGLDAAGNPEYTRVSEEQE